MLKKLELNTKKMNRNYGFKEKSCKVLHNEKSTWKSKRSRWWI